MSHFGYWCGREGKGNHRIPQTCPYGHVWGVRYEEWGKSAAKHKRHAPEACLLCPVFMLERRGQGAAEHEKHTTCRVFFVSWDGKRGGDAAKHEEHAQMDTLHVGLQVMGREVPQHKNCAHGDERQWRAAGCHWWWCWWRIVGVTQMWVVWKDYVTLSGELNKMHNFVDHPLFM